MYYSLILFLKFKSELTNLPVSLVQRGLYCIAKGKRKKMFCRSLGYDYLLQEKASISKAIFKVLNMFYLALDNDVLMCVW